MSVVDAVRLLALAKVTKNPKTKAGFESEANELLAEMTNDYLEDPEGFEDAYPVIASFDEDEDDFDEEFDDLEDDEVWASSVIASDDEEDDEDDEDDEEEDEDDEDEDEEVDAYVINTSTRRRAIAIANKLHASNSEKYKTLGKVLLSRIKKQ